MEEPPLLMPVQRIVGGVQIEHDLLWRFAVRVEKQLDQQPLDHGRIVGNSAVAVDPGRAVLQPVERALAGQGRATAVPRPKPPEHHAHDRIMPQPVVVDQVLITERDAEHPLAEERRHIMNDPVAGTAISKAHGKALDQPDRPIRGPQQQGAGV